MQFYLAVLDDTVRLPAGATQVLDGPRRHYTSKYESCEYGCAGRLERFVLRPGATCLRLRRWRSINF